MRKTAIIPLLVILIILAVIGAFGYSVVSAQATIFGELSALNSEYIDDNGDVAKKDKKVVLDNAAAWAKENKDRGLYTDYQVSESAVTFKVRGLVPTTYTPHVRASAQEEN